MAYGFVILPLLLAFFAFSLKKIHSVVGGLGLEVFFHLFHCSLSGEAYCYILYSHCRFVYFPCIFTSGFRFFFFFL